MGCCKLFKEYLRPELVIPKPESKPTEKVEEEIIIKPSPIRILLDPGHGSNTTGKRSPWSGYGVCPELDFYEWKSNRDFVRRIYSGLKEKEYDVEIIVPEDFDVSLKERVSRVNKICNEIGKENVLLLSIHSNAYGNGKTWYNNARGWAAYTSVGETKSDKFAESLYDEAEKIWKGQGGLKVRKDMSDGDRDWEENFYILYHTLCPAVLSESFFYTSEDDCRYLLSETGRQEIANVHINGIIEYLKTI